VIGSGGTFWIAYPAAVWTDRAMPRGTTRRGATGEDLPFLLRLHGTVRAAEPAPVPWPPATKQAFALQHRHYLGHYPTPGSGWSKRRPAARALLRAACRARLRADRHQPGPRGAGPGHRSLADQPDPDEAATRGCGMRLHVPEAAAPVHRVR
jgi:hypothetical protein